MLLHEDFYNASEEKGGLLRSFSGWILLFFG